MPLVKEQKAPASAESSRAVSVAVAFENAGSKTGSTKSDSSIKERRNMATYPQRISIIITAYNEEANIERSIDRASTACTRPELCELVVVDASSSD